MNFYVKPFAEINNIEINIDGIDSLSVDKNDLLLVKDNCYIKDKSLIAFYQIDNKPIDNEYVLLNGNSFKYNLEFYDKKKYNYQ